jgi:tryptophan synthase alpha subunit
VISKLADGVVVGSSIVELIEKKYPVKEIHKFIKKLADATHGI